MLAGARSAGRKACGCAPTGGPAAPRPTRDSPGLSAPCCSCGQMETQGGGAGSLALPLRNAAVPRSTGGCSAVPQPQGSPHHGAVARLLHAADLARGRRGWGGGRGASVRQCSCEARRPSTGILQLAAHAASQPRHTTPVPVCSTGAVLWAVPVAAASAPAGGCAAGAAAGGACRQRQRRRREHPLRRLPQPWLCSWASPAGYRCLQGPGARLCT